MESSKQEGTTIPVTSTKYFAWHVWSWIVYVTSMRTPSFGWGCNYWHLPKSLKLCNKNKKMFISIPYILSHISNTITSWKKSMFIKYGFLSQKTSNLCKYINTGESRRENVKCKTINEKILIKRVYMLLIKIGLMKSFNVSSMLKERTYGVPRLKTYFQIEILVLQNRCSALIDHKD